MKLISFFILHVALSAGNIRFIFGFKRKLGDRSAAAGTFPIPFKHFSFPAEVAATIVAVVPFVAMAVSAQNRSVAARLKRKFGNGRATLRTSPVALDHLSVTITIIKSHRLSPLFLSLANQPWPLTTFETHNLRQRGLIN